MKMTIYQTTKLILNLDINQTISKQRISSTLIQQTAIIRVLISLKRWKEQIWFI